MRYRVIAFLTIQPTEVFQTLFRYQFIVPRLLVLVRIFSKQRSLIGRTITVTGLLLLFFLNIHKMYYTFRLIFRRY